jgi:predicted acylesterase/phospholipase RssA
MKDKRPKIGLALSGGSGRAIAHIGVLEVFQENDIPIDYISACSSATVVAASFSAGTMEQLKHFFYRLNKKTMAEYLRRGESSGGMFSLRKVEDGFRLFTLDKKFEEVRPMLSFVACDLMSGEQVGLNLGDMARAARISCTVPGLFVPEKWGGRVLVDGGLFSLVPVEEVKRMGADIVIGVDIAATKYMFDRKYLHVWRGYSYMREVAPFRWIRKLGDLFGEFYKNQIRIVFYNQADFLDNEYKKMDMDMFEVLGKAMEIAVSRQGEDVFPCDIMLSPKVKHYGKIDTDNVRQMYKEGRRVALEALPEIKKLLKKHEWKARHTRTENTETLEAKT